MRRFILILAFCFGFHTQVEAQTSEQPMVFSIICQYVTNYVNVTNTATGVVNHLVALNTVIINSANIAKDISLQLFGTNWYKWSPAEIAFEINMVTGNQGIYLRHGIMQTNVSSFFGNNFTNMFSQNVASAYSGASFATSLPLGGAINGPSGDSITNFNFSDNLAYLTYTSPNMAFALFGYSQGTVDNGTGLLDGTLYQRNLTQGQIVGAGTFSLNVTTNIYRVVTSNGTPTNYTGLAHGSVYVGKPYFLTIGPPVGP